jgi:hypothetical protein
MKRIPPNDRASLIDIDRGDWHLVHHKSDKPPVQHMKALMEAILVFVVLPAIAFDT